MSRRFAFSFLGLAALVVTSGCATQLDKQIDGSMTKLPAGVMPSGLPTHDRTFGSQDQVSNRGAQLQRNNLVRYVQSPWVGGIQTVARTEDKLPAVFNENFTLDFGDQRVSLGVVAARLTKMTNIPVRVRSEESASTAGRASSATQSVAARQAILPTPIPGAPLSIGTGAAVDNTPSSAVSALTEITVNAVTMRWNGRLRDFLDHLTNTLSMSWEYRDGSVVLMRLVTETYEVAAFPGSQQFNTSVGGGGNGTAGGTGASGASMSSQTSTSITQQGSLDVRQTLLKTVLELISKVPGSSATWADGSGRMVVVSSKEAQAQVRDFLRKENKMLRTMVNVTFDLYSVKTKDADEKGVNWTNVFQAMNQKYGIKFSTPSLLTGASAGVISGDFVWGNGTTVTSAMLALLNQYGETSQHRPISITTLNGMWDTKSRLATEGYLKETTPGLSSASGSAGAPGLKTDTITTGDQFAVVPYVQNDNTVVLKYSISLSDLLGMFDVTTGSGATLQKVQTPRTESLSASSTIALSPGETAVITGLSRLVGKRDESRLVDGLPIVAGGSRKLDYQREHFLILVRATPL